MSERCGQKVALLSVIALLGLAGCGGGEEEEQLTPAETASEAQGDTDPAAEVTDTSARGDTAGFTLAEDVLLSEDSTGEDVVRLQEALIRLGYDPGRANGTFGAETRKAVVRFQREHGLDADGIVGPITAAAIDEALREPA